MRKFKFILLAVIISAALLIMPSLAEDEIYFTAINNTLLELSDKTMPVKQKGVFYVPNSVFNSSDLGTYCVYFRSKQLVMISDLERTLYFDMSEGTCYDDKGETYSYVAIYQNDTAYLPALFTAYYFGIEYSYITSDYAPVVRLTKGEVLSNSAFLQGAAAIMETRLAQYQAAKETPMPTLSPEPTPSQTPTPTPSPEPTPVPTPDVEPTPGHVPSPEPSTEPTPSPKPDRSNVSVYIAFLGLCDSTEAFAEQMCSQGYAPCFFACAEEIRQYPALIRKLLGIGCGVGVLLSENPEADAAEAFQLLREAAHTVTFLAAVGEELTPELRQEIENTGLRLWCAQPPEASLSTIFEQLDRSETRCDLILDGRTIDQKSVERLADQLRTESYAVHTITEMTNTAYGTN